MGASVGVGTVVDKGPVGEPVPEGWEGIGEGSIAAGEWAGEIPTSLQAESSKTSPVIKHR